jgi:transglutaminase-like putative cysteine protease
MKKLLLLILTIIFLTTGNVSASEDQVKTYHQVNYNLSENGKTSVTHKVEIKVTDNVTAVKNLTFSEPTNVIRDLKKEDTKDYTLNSLGNTVEVEFTNAIVGPKSVVVSYTYTTDQIFKKLGTTYTIEIPKIESENIEDFTLKVYLPQNLGELNTSLHKVENDQIGSYITIDKEELQNGTSIVFGNHMLYKLKIQYVISNEKSYIAIPPTIDGRQNVYVTNISKTPVNSYIDKSGNYIYEFKKEKEQIVTAEMLVKVYGNVSPQKNINSQVLTSAIKNWDYTTGVAANYLKFTQSIGENEDVKRALEFNNEYLEYDTSKSNYDYIARIGAENLNETNKNNAVCLEYSDLLIATLRGLNIPARELSGLTYEEDIKDFSFPFLHSWVDVYSKQKEHWYMVDPTWNDTANQDYLNNFDLNHIVFLIRDESSETPLLAGSYRTEKLVEKVLIEAIESNDPVKIEIGKFDFLGINLIKNKSDTFFIKTGPGKTGFYKTSDLKQFEDNNTILQVEYVKLNFTSLINPLNTVIIFLILLSPLLFLLLHKIINKRKKKVKSKVSSIGL